MSKIADVVKLKTGYANFVELKSAYEEAQENAVSLPPSFDSHRGNLRCNSAAAPGLLAGSA